MAPTQRGKSPAVKSPEPNVQAADSVIQREGQTSSPSKATVEVREKNPQSGNGLAKARYSFQAESVRELSLSKVILLTAG